MIKKKIRSAKDNKILKDFVEQYKINQESVAKLEELKQCVIKIFKTKFSQQERDSVIAQKKNKYMQLITDDGIIINDILTIKSDLDNTKLLKLAMAKGYLYDVAKISISKLSEFASPREIAKNTIGTSVIEKIVPVDKE